MSAPVTAGSPAPGPRGGDQATPDSPGPAGVPRQPGATGSPAGAPAQDADGAGPGPSAIARRLEALERLGAVAAGPEPRFDRVVRLARLVFDVPTATVSLIGADAPRDSAAPAVLEDRGPDVRLRFYAEHPLLGADGRTMGTLCIADTRPRTFTADQTALLRDLAGWVAHELGVDAELGRAQQVQMGLLPRETPRVPGYELAGACLPSRTVGGDFYDWYAAGDGLVVTLADVMGRGPAAAVLAAAVRELLRESAHGEPVDRAMLHAGAVLQTDLSDSGLFATAFHARLDPATGDLAYADAGHGLTLVVRADGTWERLDALGLPLGASDEAARALGRTTLERGDLLVTFSDGVLDLFDGSLRCLPLIAGELLDCPSADEAVQRLLRLAAVADPRPDDITVVALRRTPA